MPIIVGKRIIELRERAGFDTQQALAAKAKMDPSKLSRLENDKPVNLTLKTLERLAKTLKVPPADLFSRPGETGHAGTGTSSSIGFADSLRREIAQYERAGQVPADFRGDIMLAIFALTRALERATTAAQPVGEAREAQR